ncbi:unnamed protein product [Ambrosiozyma monospora]|uniref:D-lactate dehydrogenase (cytochrome) n=1 Tax=Ambrosiozyma monospora TaxID=43982 RepID=A0A9W6Z5V7_AMBMO|nr:unnamed protein product [Ambrosiozyma monospora]
MFVLRRQLRYPLGILKKNLRMKSTVHTPVKPVPQKSSIPIIIGCLVSGVVGYYVSSNLQTQHTSSTTKLAELKPLKFASDDVVKQGLERISKIVSEDQITVTPGELKYHSNDNSNFVPSKENELPYCVVYPTTISQVSEIVKVCHELAIPVIPFSGGTSIEGHFIPTRRGVSIDVSRMNKILKLHEDDLDVVVQPGVEWMELNEYLEPHGLMFGPDPAPGALIGGILATNASGTNAVRFGAAKDNVLSLTVVLADGTIIKTRNRPRKSSNGYNLTNLFVGSEGTLGVIVEATLKLHVKPENEVITLMNFKEIGEATKTVSEIFKKGIQCNAVEFMDDRQMTAVSEMGTGGDRNWAPDHLLLLKLSAPNVSSMHETMKMVTGIGKQNNGFNIEVVKDEDQKADIWRVRKTLLWNSLNWAKKIKPNALVLPTDVCVPVSQLPGIMATTMKELYDAGLLATASGHAGDVGWYSFWRTWNWC